MKGWTKITAVMMVLFWASGCSIFKPEIAEMTLSLSPFERDCSSKPVHTAIKLPQSFAEIPPEKISIFLKREGLQGTALPGQIVRGAEKNELWAVIPEAEARWGGEWTAFLIKEKRSGSKAFSWKVNRNESLDLLFDNRKVLRGMFAFDDSSPERLYKTYKPYYHVFDLHGKNPITKGPGGLYPHHRGIFVGWNRLTFERKEYDFWHMKGVVQKHQKILTKIAGPILARTKSLIHWIVPAGKPVVAEEREVTAFRQFDPKALLLEFRIDLKAINGDVFLNGDPEHAGFQFRAHNDVAQGGEEAKAAYLFPQDGIDPHKAKDLPWVAMSFPLNARHYCVQHMNHPANPKPTLYSAYRDYGRFGAFFTRSIQAGQTLTLRYGIFIVEGEVPTREEMEARYEAFVNSPSVEIVSSNWKGE